MPMKILVTSGGTKVPIDLVRSITNMSRGTFGSKIAVELLKQDHEIELTYLGAAEFRFPFKFSVDFTNTPANPLIEALKLWRLWKKVKHYRQLTYKTYDQYAALLKKFILEEKPDLVILAAAVSDYVVADPVDGKIRSEDDLTIALKPAEKLIGKIKEWHPGCKVVGFKLLVNSQTTQLIEAAQKSVEKNGCCFVVANDLRDIKAGSHQLHIVTKSSVENLQTDPDDPNYLARAVAIKALKELEK